MWCPTRSPSWSAGWPSSTCSPRSSRSLASSFLGKQQRRDRAEHNGRTSPSLCPDGSFPGKAGEAGSPNAPRLNRSPALEQVRDGPLWGEDRANAIRVDLRDPRGVLCGQHYIVRMHLPPEACHDFWILLPIDEAAGQPGLVCQGCRSPEGVFGRLVFQVGVDHLKQARYPRGCGLGEIEEHDRLATRLVDGALDNQLVVGIASD